MYIISETTDGEFIGTLINNEDIILGNEIMLRDFKFEVDSILNYKNIKIISNANYVIILIEKDGE